MRVIAHISDLHFGTEEPRVLAALRAELAAAAPSLIAISGDFTQRARRSQYRAASAFLASLPVHWVAVPGNHDVPLYDVIRRFVSPLGRYMRFISRELNPYFEDEEFQLLGLNTARSLTWKSGRISLDQLRLIREKLGRSDPPRLKILMTHHPFIPPPGDEVSGIDLVGRAALAVPVIEECGIDLLIAGHLHRGYSGNVAAHYPGAQQAIISAQAGTAVSRRRRQEPNAYNLISLGTDFIRIDIRLYRDSRFAPGQRVEYARARNGWSLAQDRTLTL